MTYVYKQTEFRFKDGNDLYTVGFYEPNGTWIPESDHCSAEAAADRVAYLNGGKK